MMPHSYRAFPWITFLIFGIVLNIIFGLFPYGVSHGWFGHPYTDPSDPIGYLAVLVLVNVLFVWMSIREYRKGNFYVRRFLSEHKRPAKLFLLA